MMNRQKAGEEEGEGKDGSSSLSKSYYSLPSVGSLLFTNLTYALIQFNVASLFVYMLVDFPGEGISGLGELTSAFFWESASSRSQVRYSRESLGLGESSCLARS